jgi:hypothetical protein
MGAEGWILEQDVHDARGGLAIPERWDAAGLAFTGENIVGGSDDFCGSVSMSWFVPCETVRGGRHDI